MWLRLKCQALSGGLKLAYPGLSLCHLTRISEAGEHLAKGWDEPGQTLKASITNFREVLLVDRG